ncbi:hypothetical protein HY844_03080 [Candidatus Berkelbacteria bacterium]|nr:hypothetical protein [Candidatus Berkelbacteria bacterium]
MKISQFFNETTAKAAFLIAVLIAISLMTAGCGGENAGLKDISDVKSPLTGGREGFYSKPSEHPEDENVATAASADLFGAFYVRFDDDGSIKPGGVWVGFAHGHDYGGSIIGKSGGLDYSMRIEVTHKVNDKTWEWEKLPKSFVVNHSASLHERGTWMEGPGVHMKDNDSTTVEATMYYVETGPTMSPTSIDTIIARYAERTGRALPPIPAGGF